MGADNYGWRLVGRGEEERDAEMRAELERLRTAVVKLEDCVLARDLKYSRLYVAAKAVVSYEWGDPAKGCTVPENQPIWQALVSALSESNEP